MFNPVIGEVCTDHNDAIADDANANDDGKA